MFRWKRPARRARRFIDLATRTWSTLVRASRLAVGIPDYDVYLAHARVHHPEREPMSRDAFFRERMHARYGRGRGRCC